MPVHSVDCTELRGKNGLGGFKERKKKLKVRPKAPGGGDNIKVLWDMPQR